MKNSLNVSHSLAFAKEKKIQFMRDVSVHFQSKQTARTKHNVQAHFCFYDRQTAQIILQSGFQHQPEQLMSSSKVQTFQIFSIDIQQRENFLQQPFKFIFCIQFKAASYENLV